MTSYKNIMQMNHSELKHHMQMNHSELKLSESEAKQN